VNYRSSPLNLKCFSKAVDAMFQNEKFVGVQPVLLVYKFNDIRQRLLTAPLHTKGRRFASVLCVEVFYGLISHPSNRMARLE